MLTRLVYFIVYVVIALLLAWVLTTVINLFPVIPADLKSVLDIVIWVIAFIAVVLAGLRMFAGSLPSMP